MEEPVREGKPSYNGIVSTDTRAWKQVEKWYSDGMTKKVYEKTFQEGNTGTKKGVIGKQITPFCITEYIIRALFVQSIRKIRGRSFQFQIHFSHSRMEIGLNP